MFENFWTYEDSVELDAVKSITKSIDNLYEELCNLELNNQKNSAEYKKKIDHLNLALEIEDKKYQECNFNMPKIKKWLGYIFSKDIKKPFLNSIDSIILMNYENRDLRRIINKLHNYVIFDSSSFQTEWVDKLVNNSSKKDNQKKIYEVARLVEKDILNVYLYFLNNEIGIANKNDIKKRFIKNKYYTSFIASDVEKKLVENYFEIDKKLFLESQFMADIFSIGSSTYDDIRDRYCFQVTQHNINDLINIKRIDSNDIDAFVKMTIKYLFIQSGLYIASDKFVTSRQNSLNNFINNNAERQNREGVLLALNCFMQNNRNKHEIYTLSFNQKNSHK